MRSAWVASPRSPLGARLQLVAAQHLRAARGNSQAQRLFDRAVRQVPRSASVRVDSDWPVPPLADRLRLQHFYGFIGGETYTSTFGGPVNTPTLQKLADEGLRFNRFHTTALCSPTRAALLTGRNHHSVHTGIITELATGFPGYDGKMPKEAACVAETLKQNGYSHGRLRQVAQHAGLRDQRCRARSTAGRPDSGFEYLWGFLGGETNQWNPPLYRKHRARREAARRPEHGTFPKP